MPVTSAASAIKAGTVAHFAANSAPAGWLKANGAAISRSAYAGLFAAIGTTYGAGDGSSTFNVPDLRGEFLRGLDDGRGVDSGRGIGTTQGYELQGHNHAYYPLISGSTAYPNPGHAIAKDSYNGGSTTEYVSTTGGAETRPRNVAVLACIKY